MLNKNTIEEKYLVEAEKKHFTDKKCSNQLLESYIMAHCKDMQVKNKIPKKGKLKDAEKGEMNMIRIAYLSRMKENFIEKKYNKTIAAESDDNAFEYAEILIEMSKKTIWQYCFT